MDSHVPPSMEDKVRQELEAQASQTTELRRKLREAQELEAMTAAAEEALRREMDSHVPPVSPRQDEVSAASSPLVPDPVGSVRPALTPRAEAAWATNLQPRVAVKPPPHERAAFNADQRVSSDPVLDVRRQSTLPTPASPGGRLGWAASPGVPGRVTPSASHGHLDRLS